MVFITFWFFEIPDGGLFSITVPMVSSIFQKPKRNENHPTSKPLDLLSYPIQNSSQENAIVVDTFGGSGSTLMACELTNRICYTMELDEKYASVILRRYVENTHDADGVCCIRNGEKLAYNDLVIEVEPNAKA